MTVGPHAVLATFGAPLFAVSEQGKRIDARFGDHDDAAAIAAIAAIRTAAGDVFFAAKAHAAIPAAAGFYFNGDAIDEHGGEGWIQRSGNENRDAVRHPCK